LKEDRDIMESAARIVVIGATGFTGRLVAHELARGERPFLLTGRSADRLASLAEAVGGAPTETVDVGDFRRVASVLRAGDVVINCAGPFTDLGEPVVEACVTAGAHYLDTTGEQRVMKRVLDRFDGPATQAGVMVVNAMAFEYAIGDVAAALAAEPLAPPLRSMDLVYGWSGGAGAASRGTRLSVLRVVREGGYAYRDGRWSPERTGARRRTVELAGSRRTAVWFPAGEILSVPRHVQVRAVDGWMVTDTLTANLVPWVADALPTVVRLADPLARWLMQRGPEGPTPEQRHASSFRIRAEATGSDGRAASMTVSGTDPYGLTALVAVHGANQVLERDGELSGVLAPAQVLHAARFRTMLEKWGCSWQQDQVNSA
jgi:short subunit dehydrogenase-like uncharacterized protein